MATVAGQVFANVHLLTKNPERGSVWRVDSLIATRITASRPPLHSAHLTTTFCIYCIFGSSLSLSPGFPSLGAHLVTYPRYFSIGHSMPAWFAIVGYMTRA